MTTPAGRSPRTATRAGAPPDSRANASSSDAEASIERQRRVHHLADRPLDDRRVAERPVEQALLVDRADDPDDRVALGVLGDRHLADPVLLERLDRVADALGRPGEDDRRPLDVVRGGRRAARRSG